MTRLVAAIADRYRIERELVAAAWPRCTWRRTIPAARGTPRLLAVFEDPNVSAVRGGWSFGGGRMYYSPKERQSDVWVMELDRP